MPRRTKAALSNAAALCQSKFGDDVSQPEAVRPRELHSPFGRLLESPATLAASADGAQSCYSRRGKTRVLFLDAVFVQPAHLHLGSW